jgi:hypothetical protein
MPAGADAVLDAAAACLAVAVAVDLAADDEALRVTLVRAGADQGARLLALAGVDLGLDHRDQARVGVLEREPLAVVQRPDLNAGLLDVGEGQHCLERVAPEPALALDDEPLESQRLEVG